jgi:hypothetical protein
VDVPILGQQCFGDPSSNPLFSVCEGLANLYFRGVQSVAQGPFARDQQEAADHTQRCREQAAAG